MAVSTTKFLLGRMAANQNIFAGNITAYESRWNGHYYTLGYKRELYEGPSDSCRRRSNLHLADVVSRILIDPAKPDSGRSPQGVG